MWQRLVDQKVGETREIELRKQFWNNFIDKGSGVDRLRTSAPDEAWRIVTRMITGAEAREAVLLQEEVVTIGLKLNETEAGKTLYTGLQRLLADQKEALEALLDKAKESSDSQLKKDLEREIKKIQQQFDRTFAETSSMKISFGRRILLLLFGRRSRAVSQGYLVARRY
jgi:predicted ribosome quality control (RQC) complex YloA/Tae2 family protein